MKNSPAPEILPLGGGHRARRLIFLFLAAFMFLLHSPVLGQSAEPAERTRRGFDLRIRGHLAEAEKTFEDALRTDHAGIPALLGLAEISRVKMNYPRALKYLELADQASKADAAPRAGNNRLAVLNSFGTLYLTLEEPELAAEYFDRLLAEAPGDVRGWIGKANVALLERNYEQGEVILSRLVHRKLNDPSVYAALGKVYLEQNKNQLAAGMAQHALDLDPYNVEAMAVLCSVRVIERKPEAVRKLAAEVLDLNPYQARIRRLLSQYIRSRQAYPSVSSAAQKHYETAVAHARNQDWESARREFREAVSDSPAFMQALLGLGAVSLTAGDLETATQTAEQAVRIDPDNALAQLQLSLAHLERHERSRKEVGLAAQKPQPVPTEYPVPDEIGDVFVNYHALTPEHQHIINLSVGPLAYLMPELKNRGAKHYLLPLDRRLPEIPGYETLEERTTFDGRFYGSIRGVGGLLTVSGIEYLNVVESGGFNTIAHEFAHQVHSSVFDKPLLDRIQSLYAKAFREGRTLDYYAAANEWEYFAQGYEAYISLSKRPGLGVTGRHTRDELKKTDPALFELIEELAAKGRATR